MPDGGSPSLKSQRFHFALSGPRRIHAGRGRADRRAERPDPRGPQERDRGISARNFKRQFTLADHVEVKGARFENGLSSSTCSGRSPRL
jgi:hypothetical protein